MHNGGDADLVGSMNNVAGIDSAEPGSSSQGGLDGGVAELRLRILDRCLIAGNLRGQLIDRCLLRLDLLPMRSPCWQGWCNVRDRVWRCSG